MISIIVAVYNCIGTIRKCVQSVRAQSYKNWELLLIDDGSTDGSGDICDELACADDRIHSFHKINGGVSSARNLGIDKAHGDYILFCDSDDFVAPEWCEKLLNSLRNGKGTLPVCNYYRYFTGKATVNKQALCNTFPRSVPVEDFFALNLPELLGIPWNKIYKSSIIKDNMLRFNENLSLGEDLLFVLDYISCGIKRIIFINEPLYYYAVGAPSGLSNKYYANLEEIYAIIYANLKDKLNYYEGAFDAWRSAFWHSYFYAFNRVFRNTWSADNQEDLIAKCKHNCRIFHSCEFQRCRNMMRSDEMNILQYWGLKSNSFILYWCSIAISEKIRRIIHHS